jgi:hypothetical protein
MNYVSKLNLYAQKEGKDLPTYTFTGSGTEWYCQCEWYGQKAKSEVNTNKKNAKEDSAKLIYNSIQITTITQEKLTLRNAIIMIDGDQRQDCWKWLVKQDIDESVDICIFISPTCPVIESPENFKIVKSKTTNRDSADALLLIMLGGFLMECPDKSIYIISSDHILVQAAQDLDLGWACNVADLQTLFNKTE